MQDVADMNSGVEAHEGCHIYGWLDVKRVAANFHVSVHVDDYMLLAQVGNFYGHRCCEGDMQKGQRADSLNLGLYAF